jgi:hypothetical protein
MKKVAILSILVLVSNIVFSQTELPVKTLVNEKQILLKHYAEFYNRESILSGASAFLISYQDKVYAITAKHLLGAAGGIEPEVSLGELDTTIAYWALFPRVPVNEEFDTVFVNAKDMNYGDFNNDLLILNVVNQNHKIEPLKPSFKIPQKGDKLYLIGCPYSQEDCKQNLYTLLFDEYIEEDSRFYFTSKIKVSLAGFSGAPVVDKDGNVICIVAGKTGVDLIYGVGMSEIQKIIK